MNIRILIALVTLTAVTLGACVPAAAPAATEAVVTEAPATAEATQTPEPVSLKLGILGYMSNSPLYIAQQEGYFAEQGLDVEFVDFGFTERDMIPAGIQGQLDVMAVAMNVALLTAIEQGANVRYVADKNFANPNGCAADGFLARKALLDSGALSTPADLRGKKLVLFSGNTFEYGHDLLLERGGLTNDDVQLETVFDALARNEALAAGSIDVTVHGEPWITRAKASGAADLWVPMADLMPDLSTAGLVFGPTMLEGPEDVGVRFLTAYLKGVDQFLNDRSDRTVELISEFTQLSPEEIKSVCWNSLRPDGQMNKPALSKFLTWAQSKGYTQQLLDVDQVFDGHFVEQTYSLIGN